MVLHSPAHSWMRDRTPNSCSGSGSSTTSSGYGKRRVYSMLCVYVWTAHKEEEHWLNLETNKVCSGLDPYAEMEACAHCLQITVH
eukprot:2493252-Amphidinium_carterae.1